MPDISHIEPSAIGCYLACSLVGLVPGGPEDDERFKLVARLIDKAIFEYQMTREAVLAEVAENKMSFEEIRKRDNGQFLYTCTIINHLENCIDAIVRIYKLINLDSQNRSTLTKFRNAIEHMESRIMEGATGPVALDLSEDA